jgi:hypothetical protein
MISCGCSEAQACAASPGQIAPLCALRVRVTQFRGEDQGEGALHVGVGWLFGGAVGLGR